MGDDGMLDRFAAGCGLAGPLGLFVEGPGEVSGLRAVRGPFAVLGRDPAADLVLEHAGVGRRHAYFQAVAGRVFAVDLGGQAGLLLGGASRGSGWVGPGGVGVGPFMVRPEHGALDEGVELPHPTSRSFPTALTAEVTLEVADAAPWRCSRALVLMGRSPACRLRLPGREVSAIHAALVRTPEGAWVVDLLSRAGLEVNGRAVRHALLQDGDSIRVGGHRIGVRVGRPEAAGPGTELVPAPRAAALIAGSANPDVAYLVEEFGRMQEQMGDRFQQALVGMLRLLNEQHGEQVATLREEITYLRGLVEEQRTIPARLVSPAPPRAAARPPAPPRTAPAPSTDVRPPTADSHFLLTDRLAALQAERQGTWERLVGTILGPRAAQASRGPTGD